MNPPLKLAVIRGSQPRMTEINFYSQFKKFQVQLIGDKTTGWVVDNKIPKSIKFIHSPLYPVWGFDPWTQILGKYHAHRSFQFVKNLENLVKDCDVLNISDLFYFYCWQTARIAKKLNKKLVTVVWESVPKHISTFIPPYSFAIREVMSETDLFIARHIGAANYLKSLNIDKNKIKIIYKGIDINKFIPKKNKNNNKIVVLYSGQLVKEKGVWDLIMAFKKLYHEFSHIELRLVGHVIPRNFYREVKKFTNSLPIVIDPNKTYDKMPEIYRKADIYCQLSHRWKYLGIFTGGHEHFSYSVMEAMASGLPIIATNVGGMPEQLSYKNGNIFVKPADVENIYSALKTMIKSKDRRKKTGELNRLRAQKLFDINTQAKYSEKEILSLVR